MGDYAKYIDQLNAILKDDRIHRLALSTVLAAHKRRIFQQGQDKDGGRIGTYSTKPATIKGEHYPAGYAQYKSQKGLNPGFVILKDTGSLENGYVLQVISANSEYGFGHLNSDNYQKTQWMEEKYSKKIFFSSEAEKKLLIDTINAQLNRLLKR